MPEEKHADAKASEPKVIALEEHERAISGIRTDLIKSRQAHAEAKKRVTELESKERVFSFNPEDLTEAERKVFTDRQKFEEEKSQLEVLKGELAEKERKWTAKDLAVSHGVAEETLLQCETVEEMKSKAQSLELEALRKLKIEINDAKKKDEEKKKHPKYDTGHPSVGTKRIKDMTPEEFKEYEKGLQASYEKSKK